MPELPEVETTRRGLQPFLEGKHIQAITIRESRLRWPIPDHLSQTLPGLKIDKLERRGKYLIFSTPAGHLIAHLGMSGRFHVVDASCPHEKHDHYDLILDNNRIIRYRDPRKFGALLWTDAEPELHRLLNHLGPEPLSRAFNANYLKQKLTHKKTNIKTSIMDSRVVVGVGNIYANEALFLSGIHPLRIAGRLADEELKELTKAIKRVLKAAIKQGGTSLKDFAQSDGQPGYFKQKLKVYGRENEACVRCKESLQQIRIAGRTTVFCESCQS